MVRVSGHLNWLTLQGTCPAVIVSGMENRVRIEAVGRLHVSGFNNVVAWERSLQGDTPEVVECHRVTGEDCFYMKLHVRSVEHLEEVIDRFTPYGQTTTSIIQSSPVARRGLELGA